MKFIFNMKAITSLVVAGFLLLTGCDSILPDSYDADKKFKLSGIDATACTILTDSARIYVPIEAFSLNSLVDSATFADNSAGFIIQQNYDTLLSRTNSITENSLLQVDFAAGINVNYAKLEVTGESIFYLSWEIDQSNESVFIDVDLVQRDTTFAGKDLSYNRELFGCTTTYPVDGGNDGVAPVVRTRSAFKVSNGTYLVRFFISQPTQIASFHCVLLQGN